MLREIARKAGIGKAFLHVRQLLNRLWHGHQALGKSGISEALQVEKRIEDSKPYFASIKNKYAGRRGFVIGNGPSLKLEDLEKIKDEITIAANKVYLAFDKVSWRPSFLTIADPLVWDKVQKDIWLHHDNISIPSYLPEFQESKGRAKTFRYLGTAPDLARENGVFHFSDNFCVGAYAGYTVTYENIQLAVHLGLNPIYIIGCDHFYRGESKQTANNSIETTCEGNHFLPGYRKLGEIVKVAPIEEMTESYQQARLFAEAHGIEILNATRGGYLEVFARVNFDEIIEIAGK
jgi:hypothetical protein